MPEMERRIIDFIALADGEGLTLAHDIAAELDLAPRGMGFRLRALERKGLIERKIARRRPSLNSDHLYGWRLTPKGREVAWP